jgi:glycosyltransferase involved in cell wall biosynthesis
MSRPTLTVASLSTSCWGAEQSLLLLVRHAEADVTIAAPAGELLVRAAEAGLRTVELTSPSILRCGSIGSAISTAGTGPALLAAAGALVRAPIWSADIVVSFSQWLHLPLALAGRVRRHEVALDLHDGPFSASGAKIQAAGAWAASRSVSVSTASLQYLGSWPAKRVSVIPRAVAIPAGIVSRASARTSAADPLRLVVVGRLDPEKHVDKALAVHERLRAAGVAATLDVVGAPTDAGVTVAEFAGRWPQATFHGRLSYSETLQRVADSDILLSMASGEAFGRTVVEAALVGVPAIVSGGGPAERIRSGVTGYVVPLDEPDRLVELLGQLSADPAAVREMGERAREEAQESAAPGPIAARWLSGCLETTNR